MAALPITIPLDGTLGVQAVTIHPLGTDRISAQVLPYEGAGGGVFAESRGGGDGGGGATQVMEYDEGASSVELGVGASGVAGNYAFPEALEVTLMAAGPAGNDEVEVVVRLQRSPR